MDRGWGVHDASDELARLSLDGGQGIASEKQVVQRHARGAVKRIKALYLEMRQTQRYRRSCPLMSSTALSSQSSPLPHRAPQALANHSSQAALPQTTALSSRLP
jgi:hypothetical protein